MDVASSHVPVETLITGLGNTAEEGGDSTWSQSAAEEPNARLQQGHDNTRDIATDRSDEKGILSQKNSERQVTEEEEDDLIDLSDLVEVLQLADIDTRISGSKEKSSDEKDVLSSEIEGLRVDDRELRELQMIGAETVKLGKRREDYTPNPTAPEFVPTNSGPMDHTTSLSAPSTTAHTSSGSENRATGPGSSRNSHSTPVRQLQTPQQQFTFPSDLPANQIETLFKAVNYLFRQVKTAKDRFNRDKGRLRMAGRSNLQLDLFLGQLGKGLSSQQDKTHLDNSRDMLVALRNQVDDVEISLDQMFLAMKTTEEEIERLLGDNGLDMRIVGDRLT
ncbi:MAG: hypothetical protein M1812_007668 [Candelaria pacifica]|nr:MAG: hypothetical protein M1812_007668 [Candelaria pacifica]